MHLSISSALISLPQLPSTTGLKVCIVGETITSAWHLNIDRMFVVLAFAS